MKTFSRHMILSQIFKWYCEKFAFPVGRPSSMVCGWLSNCILYSRNADMPGLLVFLTMLIMMENLIRIFNMKYSAADSNSVLLCTNWLSDWLISLQFGFNTLRPGQNGWHLPDDIFQCIFLKKNAWILIKISLNFIPKGSINNILPLV